jgi:hypothetical protein
MTWSGERINGIRQLSIDASPSLMGRITTERAAGTEPCEVSDSHRCTICGGVFTDGDHSCVNNHIVGLWYSK